MSTFSLPCAWYVILRRIFLKPTYALKILFFLLSCLAASANAQEQEIVFNRVDSAATNTTSLSLSKPAVLSASDLIIIHIQINDPYDITPPSGFITLSEGINGNMGFGTFYLIASGTEASTFTFTSTGASQWVVSTVVVRNVNTKSPFENTATSYGAITGSTGSITTPAITPATSEGLLLVFGSVRHSSTSTGTITEPAGMTLVHKKVSNLTHMLLVASENLSSSAAIPARTINFTPIVSSGGSSNRRYYSVSLVIRKAPRTLFSYQSGNYNDPTSWTLDPSGTTLTPAAGTLPAVYDSLVVLNGRTISLTANTNSPWIGLQLNEGSVFNLAAFTIDSLTCISGKGRLRSSRNNSGSTYFPAVFGNNWPILQDDGGIVEYYASSNLTLNTSIPGYHSLELKREGSGTSIYTLASNVTLTGNLSVTRTGTATSRLLFGNSTTSRILTVSGDVTVRQGGEIQVSTYNSIHQLNIAGSLLNYGSCRFTNRTAPDYVADATDGIIEVTFSGSSDEEINCYGVTDFYRLILNKGIDQTFVLTVNSSSTANFRLLGRNDQANGGVDPNPTVLKSLFIQNGTLRLKNNVLIASLTEGGNDFFIGLNACLWVDGANVYSCESGINSRGITVIGKFRLTSGSVNTLTSAGMVYRTDAQIVIEGGSLIIGQFRRSTNPGDYRASYMQSGGSVMVTGEEDNPDYSRFSIPFSDCAFSMSGGTLELRSPTTNAANNLLDIQVSALNYSVTGGEIIINSNNAALQPVIYSSGPFFNLTIVRNAGADVLASGPVTVINDLLLGSGNPVLSMNDNNLSVSGDLVINTGAALVSGANTLTFNGSGKQLFTVNGTLSGNLNNLVIEKISDTLQLSGSVSSVIVAGSFSLNSGIFQDGGKILECRNAVNLSGRHIGAGKILLSNVNSRTLTGDGNGVFTNIEFNAPSNADITVDCNLTIRGTLTFTGTNRRVIDMGSNRMVLDTFSRIVNAGTNRFIRFNGSQSAGGLTKVYDSLSFTFPIGSGTGATYDYTPATITFSNTPGAYGSLNIKPVSVAHPALTATGQSLDYYWRTTATGFTLGGATVSHNYTYIQGDVLTGTGIAEVDYVPALFNTTSNTWVSGTSAAVDATNNVLTFSGVSFGTTLTGEFTAGDNSPVNPFGTVTVYYSRVNNGAWATASTWTTNPDHTTIATPAIPPTANSIVRIGNGSSVFHTIEVNANSATAGALVISTGSTLDLNATTGHNFGSVSGEASLAKGKLLIGRPAATYSFPAGDFGIFLSANGGEVEYYNTTTSDVTLPASPSSYNKISLNTSSSGDIYLPNSNLVIYDSLIVKSAGTGEIRTNNTNSTLGNLDVGKSLVIQDGEMEINNPGSVSARTINIEGDLRVYSGSSFAVAATGTALTHQINIKGNILNEGTCNLRPSASYMANCLFTGLDTSRITGTNAGAITTLNGLTINKGSDQSAFFEINVAGTLTTQSNGWLTLQNGTFRFSKASTITIWNTDVTYEIPLSVKFSVNNSGATVNMGAVAGDAADLVLRGKLEILNGTVNIGTSTNNTNNDLEIASAGQPEIEVAGAGVLNVNGQIRRGLATLSGSLVYRQSGTSTVLVRGRNANTARGMFEVLNTGSYFSMSGTPVLQLLRGGSVNFADLYIRPDSTSVSGGTVLLKPTGVGSSQSYTLDVIHTFYNLTIENDAASNATADLTINALSVKNNLTVASGGTINTNSLDVSIGGKFTKSGTYNGVNSKLTFVSNTGILEGVFSSQSIYSLRLDSAAVLRLTGATTSIRIENELNIARNAEFYDSSKLVDVRGNIVNAGTHISSSNSGTNTLVMAGTVAQEISGGGVFGNIVINNPMGVYLRSSITVNRLITLSNGIFDINEYLLAIGTSGDISGSFSVTRMIRTNGVLSDGGIRRNITAGAINLFYPVGVLGKYTPAGINISSNTAAGSVTIRPVNSKHPSTRLAADSQLTFYWQVDTTGLGTLQATHTYVYNALDITGTEANYRTGKYIFPNWSPLNGINGTVNAATNTITLTSVNYIGGGFTAGVANEFGGVNTYYSRKSSGNWTDLDMWSTTGHNGAALVSAADLPSGAPVKIASGHTVSVNSNNRLAESIELLGTATLDLNNSFGHNFGVVTGTGTIRISATTGQQFVFPGGNYSGFTSGSGGTVEYYGTNAGILPTQTAYNHLVLKDNSARSQPSVNITVNGNFTLQAGTLSNAIFNKSLELKNNWTNSAGIAAYDPGNGTVIFSSASSQAINGATRFYNMTHSGGGSKTINDSAVVYNELLLNGGLVFLGNNHLFLDSNASTGGNNSESAMLVQNGTGRIIKRFNSVSPGFNFPIGEQTGTTEFSPVTLIFSSGTFASNAMVSVQVTDAMATECTGSTNSVSRYWTFSTSGISSFNATVTARYSSADVGGTEASVYARMSRPGQACVNGLATNTATNVLTFSGGELNILTGAGSPQPGPNLQASKVFFTSIAASQMRVTWTKGNGQGRLVLVRSGSSVNTAPVDATVYTADSSFSGAGSVVNVNNKVVYKGADSSFLLTGLSNETFYHVAIFEFNNTGAEIDFLSLLPATGVMKTLAAEPTLATSSLTFQKKGNTSLRLHWSGGNGASRLIIARATNKVTAVPADRTSYTASAVFGSGQNLGSSEFVVYKGNADSVTISGLTQNTLYHFDIYQFNGSDSGVNYLTTTHRNDSQHTYIKVEITVFLEGAFEANRMFVTNSINLPKKHSFKNATFGFSDFDSIQNLPNDSLVDWVMIELRKAPSAATALSGTIVGRAVGFVRPNGKIIDTSGSSGLIVPTTQAGNYYVVVHHRNHISVMSANTLVNPAINPNDPYTYNFTTAVTQAYGTNALVNLGAGIWGIYAGRNNGTIIDEIYRQKLWTDRNKTGYQDSDVYIDGIVDAGDRSKGWNNRTAGSQVPQ